MTKKTRNIVGWVLAGLLGIAFLGSGFMKLSGNPEALKGAASFGVSAGNVMILGIVEVLPILLFLYPRTGVVGFGLLSAYMGGAIATHLQHSLPITAPIVLECLVWITAAVRFPELTSRLMGNTTSTTRSTDVTLTGAIR